MNTHLHQHHQHQQTCFNASKLLMEIGVTSNVIGFDPIVPGAAPGSPELCLSYSGFITPGCDSGNMDSNSIRHPILGAISKDRNAAACNPATQPCKSAIALHFKETLARMRHRIRRHLLMVRKPDFHSGNAGSIPADASNSLCAALAQWTEHVATNDGVGSSNLSCGGTSRWSNG